MHFQNLRIYAISVSNIFDLLSGLEADTAIPVSTKFQNLYSISLFFLLINKLNVY